MIYDILIIGGGVAAMKAAICAEQFSLKCAIIERETSMGGHVNGLYKLFPDDTLASELMGKLQSELKKCSTDIFTSHDVISIDTTSHSVICSNGRKFEGKTIIIATGYKLFDAALKQEYGHGIYDNVVTSFEFEKMLKDGKLLTTDGRVPEKIAFLHCVGSRDEKVMQNHCSKVCCVTAVRQAISVRQVLPQCKTYCFYMDIRMYGAGYEEMYRTAQQDYQIHFIRGRISETGENIDKTIIMKAEDTLIGKPIRLTVDMMVLMVGICSNNEKMMQQSGLELYKSGFLKPVNSVDMSIDSAHKGVFYAGCASAPKNIAESISDATSAVFAANNYIKQQAI